MKYPILFSLMVSLCTPVFSIIESISLNKKGTKKVVILGDFHAHGDNNAMTDIDKRDAALVFSFIKQIASQPNTIVLLEASDWQLDCILKEIKATNFAAYLGLITQLPQFARTHKMAYGKLMFEFGDIRNNKIADMCEFMWYFDMPEFKNANRVEFLRPLAKKQFGHHSFAELFSSVDAVIVEAEEFKKTCDEPIANYLQELITRLAQSKERGRSLFTDHKVCYFDAFIDLVKKDGFDALMINYTRWMGPLFSTVADIGFVIKLAKCLKKADTVIAFGGNNHACALRSFLKASAYESVFQNGSLEATHMPQFKGGRFTHEELQSLLNTTASTVYPGIQIKTELGISNQLIAQCSICKKEGKANTCSRCRAKTYCSVECQKKDWPEHKLVCKK